jgi:hypothetical protein
MLGGHLQNLRKSLDARPRSMRASKLKIFSARSSLYPYAKSRQPSSGARPRHWSLVHTCLTFDPGYVLLKSCQEHASRPQVEPNGLSFLIAPTWPHGCSAPSWCELPLHVDARLQFSELSYHAHRACGIFGFCCLSRLVVHIEHPSVY